MIKKFLIIEDFISKEALSGILLFIATVAAVIVANSSLGQSYFDLWNMPLGITLGDKNDYNALIDRLSAFDPSYINLHGNESLYNLLV